MEGARPAHHGGGTPPLRPLPQRGSGGWITPPKVALNSADGSPPDDDGAADPMSPRTAHEPDN
jgi:hypothetical protein